MNQDEQTTIFFEIVQIMEDPIFINIEYEAKARINNIADIFDQFAAKLLEQKIELNNLLYNGTRIDLHIFNKMLIRHGRAGHIILHTRDSYIASSGYSMESLFPSISEKFQHMDKYVPERSIAPVVRPQDQVNAPVVRPQDQDNLPVVRPQEQDNLPVPLSNVYYIDATDTAVQIITDRRESTVWLANKDSNMDVGRFISDSDYKSINQTINTIFDTGNGSITMISKELCDLYNIPIRPIYATDQQIQLVNMILINEGSVTKPIIPPDKSNLDPIICYGCQSGNPSNKITCSECDIALVLHYPQTTIRELYFIIKKSNLLQDEKEEMFALLNITHSKGIGDPVLHGDNVADIIFQICGIDDRIFRVQAYTRLEDDDEKHANEKDDIPILLLNNDFVNLLAQHNIFVASGKYARENRARISKYMDSIKRTRLYEKLTDVSIHLLRNKGKNTNKANMLKENLNYAGQSDHMSVQLLRDAKFSATYNK